MGSLGDSGSRHGRRVPQEISCHEMLLARGRRHKSRLEAVALETTIQSNNGAVLQSISLAAKGQRVEHARGHLRWIQAKNSTNLW